MTESENLHDVFPGAAGANAELAYRHQLVTDEVLSDFLSQDVPRQVPSILLRQVRFFDAPYGCFGFAFGMLSAVFSVSALRRADDLEALLIGAGMSLFGFSLALFAWGRRHNRLTLLRDGRLLQATIINAAACEGHSSTCGPLYEARFQITVGEDTFERTVSVYGDHGGNKLPAYQKSGEPCQVTTKDPRRGQILFVGALDTFDEEVRRRRKIAASRH